MAIKWKARRSPSSSSDEATVSSPPRPSITSRIARAFSMSVEAPRAVVQQNGRLFGLPYELREQIFDEVGDVRNLRGTCSALNEQLAHRVFGELHIDSVARGSYRTGSLLKTLASGKNRGMLWNPGVVHTLRITNVLIFSGGSTQSSWQASDPNLQPLQERYIGPAIKEFKNLKRVFWALKIKDPYVIIADALASLPLIEELHVTFDHWVSTSIFPFDKFGRLTTLALERGDYEFDLANSAFADLRKCIEASPNLVNLRIGIPIVESLYPPTFGDLGLEGRHIRRVKALDAYWQNPTLPLGQLTHVDIPNISENIGAWAAFASSKIRLVSVTVQNTSACLVRYLKSYSGLEVLRIENVEEAGSALAAEVYAEVLPLHTGTLKVFWVEAAFRSLSTSATATHPDTFTLTPKFFPSVLGCTLLEELCVPAYHGRRGPPLSDLMGALTQLRRLKRIRLEIACADSTCGVRGFQMCRMSMQAAIQSFEIPDIDDFNPCVEFRGLVFTFVKKDEEEGAGYSLKVSGLY